MKAETFRLENCPMSNFRSSHTDTSALRKKVNDAFKINDYLGVQVMAMAYFGLRPAESVSLELRSLSVPKADVLLSMC